MSVIVFTVSNIQVYSDDEFDLWPVYSGEQIRASWPLVYVMGMAESGQLSCT